MAEAAMGDLQSLLPRGQAQAEVLRHATKLEYWSSGKKIAFDVPVVSVAGTEFFEARLTDHFGLSSGLSLILWDDASFCPEGRVWILVVCQHDEVGLRSTLGIAVTRRGIIEERNNTWNRQIFE